MDLKKKMQTFCFRTNDVPCTAVRGLGHVSRKLSQAVALRWKKSQGKHIQMLKDECTAR